MPHSPRSITILGIDPGSQCLGWGVVQETSGVLRLLGCGTVRPKSEVFEQRLGEIFSGLTAVIRQYSPQEVGVENVFVQKNVASALKLGQARGAAIAACTAAELPVFSYEPTVIKKSLVGAGRAEKSQVSFMVGRILGVTPTWAVDAGDALGCAICHSNMRRMQRLAGM